jgi:dihydrolipoamide dehydrogenase
MYDLIVLGGGPAGYHAAAKAGAAGLHTVLIEKRHLGGVCLNEGCIPSKTLLHSAKLFSSAKNSQPFGVTVSGAAFDLPTVMARKQKLIELQRKGIAGALKKSGVTVETGEGIILPKQNDAFHVKVGDRIVPGKRLLICTGSEAIRPPIRGSENPMVLTNREILSVDRIPNRLAVIGGGAIGLELAVFFAEIGSSVTVIELLPSIGGVLDGDIASILLRELEKIGIAFQLESKVTAIGDGTVAFEHGGTGRTVDADRVLLSVGRRPLTKGIGLEAIGIATVNGRIVTDGQGRTGIPDVWAAGDVNGVSMLAHTAYREADACVNDMFGRPDRVPYEAIPAVIYTHPEVAVVGMTLVDAEKAGIPARSHKLPLSVNGRYLAETEGGRGLCKVVVDRRDGTVVGVHMIGGSCSEMIFGAAAMIHERLKIDDIEKFVFPHPTVSEIIKDTMGFIDLSDNK